MPDYSQGKIYAIRCIDTGRIYIGSTCCSLELRLRKHKNKMQSYIRHNNMPRLFNTSFSILLGGNYSIYLLEEYPCQNLNELLLRERHYIETMPCINKMVPIRSEDERQVIEFNRKKKWIERNRERLTQIIQCECGVSYQYRCKWGHIKSAKHCLALTKTPESALLSVEASPV